jgi:hypothetical protein
MKPVVLVVTLFACIIQVGCNGHAQKQAELAKLEEQYKIVNKQYNDDCVVPMYGAKGAESYLKGTKPKVPTPQEEAAHNQKCAQELKQVKAIEQQMQALQQ